jgi:hypothetical protein
MSNALVIQPAEITAAIAQVLAASPALAACAIAAARDAQLAETAHWLPYDLARSWLGVKTDRQVDEKCRRHRIARRKLGRVRYVSLASLREAIEREGLALPDPTAARGTRLAPFSPALQPNHISA